jgi:hypothetical protein
MDLTNIILNFILLNPNLIAHIVLGVIGLVSLVGSGGAPELIAAGVFLIATVALYVIYRVVKLSRFLYLYVLYFGALLASLSALIINATTKFDVFWSIWHAIALPIIIGCAFGVYSRGKGNNKDISIDNSNSTKTGVTSVGQVKLQEGQACIVYHYEGSNAGNMISASNNGNEFWKIFTSYRILHGPGKFNLKANEWCHYFTWTHPWSRPLARYPPEGHVLSTLEDHIFAKMDGLRTTDNKSIFLDVYIFFRLVDVDKLVKTQMDPIFAFRGLTREDIFRFVARKSFTEFVRERRVLCDLSSYPALLKYAESIGFSVTRVVCIDYKDKPETWKLTHRQGNQKQKQELRRRNKSTDGADPHEYDK